MSRTAARPATAVLPVALLRDAVAREVARRSLRGVAQDVGISPNGLRNFVNGAVPRPATRAKLERWLGRNAAEKGPSLGHLVRLVEELSGEFAPDQAAALGRDIAQLVASTYERRHRPPPRWVRELITHYRAGPGKRS